MQQLNLPKVDISPILTDLVECEISMLTSLLSAIKKWEDRIFIIESKIKLTIDPDNNSAFISIPYIIKERQLKAAFQRKITQ